MEGKSLKIMLLVILFASKIKIIEKKKLLLKYVICFQTNSTFNFNELKKTRFMRKLNYIERRPASFTASKLLKFNKDIEG